MKKSDIRILLVDDEVDYLDAMAFFLRARGYNVATSPKSRDVLKHLNALPPDIIFIDLQMPDMDGITLLTEVRRINPFVPVVIVTAYSLELDIQKATQLNVAGIFPKTDTFIKLESVIEVVLRTHKKLKSA